MADNKCALAIIKTLSKPTIQRIGITGAETDAELSKIVKKGITDLNNEKASTITSAQKLKEVNDIITAGKYKLMSTSKIPEVDTVMAILSESTKMGKHGELAAGFVSLEDEAYAIRLGFESQLHEYMSKMTPGKLGFGKSKIGQENMIRFIFDPNANITDAGAKGFATAWKKLTDDIADAFNEASGNPGAIQKLETYVMPQKHDKGKMLSEGKGIWREMAKEVFDSKKMLKILGFEEDKEDLIPVILDAIYDSITNDGYRVVKGPNFKLRRQVSKLHQESRIMHFKGGDEFIKYQQKFGNQNYYEGMMSYLDRISKEIAAMRKFGPNPDYVVGEMIKTAEDAMAKAVREGRLGKFAEFKAKVARLEHVYADLMGRTMSRQNRLASTMLGLRNIEYGAKLGFAAISALTDISFTGITARLNSVPAMKTYFRQIKNLFPGVGKSDQEFALRLGVMSDFVSTRANQVHRFGESTGTGWTAGLADFTIKASGLNHWTITAKNAFSLEFLSAISKVTKQQKLPPKLKQALARYGVGDEDLAVLAKSETLKHEGVDFIDPQKLDQDLRNKIVGMIHSETRYAVPEPNARVRAIIHRGTQGGTATGELMRMMGQLKTFPLTIMTSHWARAANLTGTTKLKYFASLFVGTYATGMIAQYTYDAAKGNLRSPSDPKFLMDALDRGGALGAFGDFMNASDRRYGLPGFFGGPLIQSASDAFKILTGNYEVVMLHEKRYIDKLRKSKIPQAMKFVENHVPGQVWWMRLAIDRMIWENINALADPNIQKKHRRINKRYRNEDRYSWWKAGDTLPKF